MNEIIQATDLLLDYKGNPGALDRTLRALPGVVVALLQGEAAPEYKHHEGCYVARVFGPQIVVDIFTSMVERQGYCGVIRQLDKPL